MGRSAAGGVNGHGKRVNFVTRETGEKSLESSSKL